MISRAMLSPKFQFSVLSLQFSVLLALIVPAFPQATFPSPTITSILPLGGKAGSSIQLTLRGGDLDEPKAILLNERSIPITSSKGRVLDISLPAALKTGLYDLRFVGLFGVSNPRVFEISPLTIFTSPGSNTKPETAFGIQVNSIIQGAFKAATPQWFSFDAKKGQAVVASFDGQRFDTRTELVGAVSDTSGHELARLKNGVMSFVPPADGTYRLRLNDLMHRGGDDYGFRVSLRFMPPAPLADSSGPQPTTTPIKIGDTITDTFPEQGAARVYDLTFKAGDKFVIEVRSHQLGHASDPHLYIELLKPDGSYSPVAQVADAPVIVPAPTLALPNRDPSYAYEAKAGGAFRIFLNDNFNTIHPFQLRVAPAPGSAPGLIALNPTLPKAAANARPYEFGTANVCRGGILAFEIAAPNRHALSEAIELKGDTPLPGLTCLGGFIGKGQSLGCLAFQAAADAPAGAAIVSSIAEAAYVSFPVADAARDYLLVRRAGPPAIGVSTLSSPALIQTEKSEIYEVAADGKLDIPLKITRHADFTDALKLKALGLLDNIKAPEADIAAKATTGKFTLDVKALKLTPGEYGFILQGPAKMKTRRNPGDAAAKEAPKEYTFIVCSNPIRIRVKEAAKK